MDVVEIAHASFVAPRRLRRLCDHLCGLLPPDAAILDVGCGDGRLTRMIGERRPDLRLTGVEVFVRAGTSVPVTVFDGTHLPFPDGAFDGAMVVDVFHHADDPLALLREIRRVSRRSLVVKDHLLEGPLAFATLALMDFAGNPRQGVAMRHAYWPRQRWHDVFRAEGWRVDAWVEALQLYGWPLDRAFGRSLHFIASLSRC